MTFGPTADAVARSELAGLLRGAEQRGELRLDYEPIVELEGGAVIGVEALVRWQLPGRPLLMPDQFIDLAEQTGDIVPMGSWILRDACRQTRDWQVRLSLPDLQVSVNLSARQFQEQDLVETVRTVLEETELAPSSLVLEGERPDAAHNRDDRPADRASVARHPPGHRRLRDRLLLAELPGTVPGRHPQDRSLVHRRAVAHR